MAVYFIRQGVTGNVKIGFATDVTKRIKQLQTGQHVRLVLMRLVAGDTVAEEKAMQRRFAHVAISGEWFRFHPDMLSDLGVADLPMPTIGKHGRSHNWPTSPFSYQRALNQEILQIIGGEDDFARRCGLPPWKVVTGWDVIRKGCWSAAIVMLTERGRTDITREMLVAARKALVKEYKGSKRTKAAKEAVEHEARWIKDNPGVAPWWPIAEQNKALLKPRIPELAVVGGSAA